jgi:O-antigen/teichoic acid export membrane protein
VRFLIKGFIFRIVVTVAGFLVSLLIAKLAGAEGFGGLSLMIVNAAFIQIITGLGTDAAIIWHGISGKPEERNKIFSFTFYTALLQLLLFGISAFIFLRYTGKTILSGETQSDIFYIELLYFTGLVLTEKYAALFYSQQMAALCNKLLAVVSSGLIVIFLVLYIFLPDLVTNNPAGIYGIFIFIPAILLLLYYHVKFNPVLKRINREGIKSFANFSFIVLITNIIQFIAFRADFWVIDYFHGKTGVGIYAQASRFSQMLWIVPGVLAGLIVPSLKNKKNKLSMAELAVICRLLFFTHVFLAAVVIIGAYIIYQYFLPADFFDGFPALVLMIPGYIIFIITTVLAAYFSANRLLRINLSGSFLCCVLMLGLDILLIPKFSFTGAAIANLVAYTITTAFFVISSHRQTGMSIKDYFIVRKSDLKILSARFSGRDTENEV